MNNKHYNIADNLIELSKKFGAIDSEVVIENSIETNVEAKKGNVELSETSDNISISLRVINNRKSALVSSNNTSEEGLKNLAIKANEIAKESLENPFDTIANRSEFFSKNECSNIDICDNNNFDKYNISKFEEMAITADDASFSNSKIVNTDGSSVGSSNKEFILCTSNGFKNGYKRSFYYISSSAIATDMNKMEREYAFEQRTYIADLPAPEEIGKLAAERALKMTGATKPLTGKYPIIFNERISSSIISHILNAINGQSITRGSSWLLNYLDNKIIPENLNIIEDPYIPRLSGSRPFDAEGLVSKKNIFVENGILKKWVLDLKTSKQLGLKSTSNAFRTGSGYPYPNVGNIELVGGDLTLDELLEKANEGLMVCSMIGSTINQNSGDYSRGAAGFWFKNGKISHPVNECTIAGNLKQMIQNMTIATDIKPHLSRRVPSILINDMTVAGN